MRFRSDASLDTSQVSDRRGMRTGGLAVGGGGVIGIVVLLVSLLTGGDPGAIQLGGGTSAGGNGPEKDLSTTCVNGDDANQKSDCRIVGVINSVQAYWAKKLPEYHRAKTVFFDNPLSTGCGTATSDIGPFYCPTDQQVYIDLGFYRTLQERFGAQGGPFAEAYVLAHEYGHHVENIRGVLAKATSRATGPQSPSVRVELQADCLAGMWAKGAVETKYIEDLTEEDIRLGLDAAAAVGDDRIQQTAQGRVDKESWTHGSAEQRQKWFLAGYRSGDLAACDTFAAPTV